MQSVIYVDSRMRTGGASDSGFQIDLRDTFHLESHGMRIDNLRLTNSFYSSVPGRFIYYKDGSGGIAAHSIPE